jgi:hypothetical protein
MSHTEFDYARYVRLLEQHRLPVVVPERPTATALRRWVWRTLPSYNGFSHEERVRGWQVQCWAEATGALTKPKGGCSICGSTVRVGWHGENYFDPWTSVVVCQSCHFRIHRRFREPRAWEALQTEYGGTASSEWITWLPTYEIDLASYLRSVGVSCIAGTPTAASVGLTSTLDADYVAAAP